MTPITLLCQQCGLQFVADRSDRKFCCISCRAEARKHRFDRAAFEALIDKTGDCWIWLGRRSSRGYGRLRSEGRWIYAHRLSYELYTGKPLGSAVGMHSCDNPLCVRPDHIEPGTINKNFKDMWRRKRGHLHIGDNHPRSRITSEIARRIYADPRPVRTIARELGYSRNLVRSVKTGATWAHATGATNAAR